MKYDITGAQILRPGGFDHGRLSVSDGCFVDVPQRRQVDLGGFWVLPGIVDIHGDGFERHLAPRRGAVLDLKEGLVAVEAELAANGITTAVLAQFYSWEGGMRSPNFAQDFLRARATMKAEFDTDLRVQLRFETHMLDHYVRFYDLVCKYEVPYVVFNDHVPHGALAAGKKPPRLTGQALKSGRSPDVHLSMLKALYAGASAVPRALYSLAEQLKARNTLLGSHDDADLQVRQTNHAIGAEIAEFPKTAAAAEAAIAMGGKVVLGAPNVVRGRSHQGNANAAELAKLGLCSALASDYHYPSLRFAALTLAKAIGIERAWQMVSSGPAQMLGLSDRGTLAHGLRGDFIVLNPQNGRVMACFAKGQPSYLTAKIAEQFL
ncbi:MAG: alpha-D-ribose 1-methylphosphonate 5-triphosphate diphosphatase [Paracoccaceae bacterium]|nr:alpha-D-ribose 1-methylphosphonate 5-triphosphate diphosphatase [Paracoccaceae bacterium]